MFASIRPLPVAMHIRDSRFSSASLEELPSTMVSAVEVMALWHRSRILFAKQFDEIVSAIKEQDDTSARHRIQSNRRLNSRKKCGLSSPLTKQLPV